MRIAVIGTLWLRTPPGRYGGTEEVVFNLVNELVTRGHEVTFFGPANARVNARIVSQIPKSLRELGVDWHDDATIHHHLLNITAAFDRRDEFDVIHVHLNKSQDYMALPLAAQSQTPWVFTFHFVLPSLTFERERYDVLEKYKYLPYTSISDSQRADSDINFITTVHNSLAINEFPFSPEHDDYFVWLGRVKPDKGTKEAILAAKKAGVKLYMMGAVDDGEQYMIDYYEHEVKPLIDGKQIVWLGEADLKTKVKYLSRAKALLNPIQWEEPFGLVMVESQCVGTPVVSFARGAAPELIQDGKTGFLVDNLSEMVKRMKDIDTINRADCRANVEENFTIGKMVSGYEKAYTIAKQKWPGYLKRQQHALEKLRKKQ